MRALPEELDHLGGQEVFVLLQELVSVVGDLPGEVAHREVQPLCLGLDVVLRLDVVVELICRTKVQLTVNKQYTKMCIYIVTCCN